MKIGICAPFSRLEQVRQMGFDYLEVSASAIGEMGETEFAACAAVSRRLNFHVECCNCLIPGSYPLLSGELDTEALRTHLHRAFRRMQQLGSRVAVFGSGQSRTCPPSLSLAEGWSKLTGVTKRIGEIASLYGIRIAIEPLNRSETNLINSVREGARLAADVRLENVGVMADSYHMFAEEEPLEDILRVNELFHAHIALLEGRRFPIRPDAGISKFLRMLTEIGYDEKISIEGNTDSFETDAPQALALLRELLKQW